MGSLSRDRPQGYGFGLAYMMFLQTQYVQKKEESPPSALLIQAALGSICFIKMDVPNSNPMAMKLSQKVALCKMKFVWLKRMKSLQQ